MKIILVPRLPSGSLGTGFLFFNLCFHSQNRAAAHAQ